MINSLDHRNITQSPLVLPQHSRDVAHRSRRRVAGRAGAAESPIGDDVDECDALVRDREPPLGFGGAAANPVHQLTCWNLARIVMTSPLAGV